jgi:serine/threonine protein kinase
MDCANIDRDTPQGNKSMLEQTFKGRYRIISRLGGGGFGQTYLAVDETLPGNPQCVIKQIQPQSNDQSALEIARGLFKTEVEILKKINNHNQIAKLLDEFEEKQKFYLVQQFVEGHDLSKEIRPGKPLSEARTTVILWDILEILDFIHEQNVIHCDLKPSNIRRKKDGKLVLIDFGAIKQISTQITSVSKTKYLTVSVGTPGYIPGEQAQGKPKFSSDIYAVGIMGIQAITGLLPEQFSEDSKTGEISWRERVQVSPKLANFLDKMVRYDFRQRYSSAAEALQALATIAANNAIVMKGRNVNTYLPKSKFSNPLVNEVFRLCQQFRPILQPALQSLGVVAIAAVTSMVVVNFANKQSSDSPASLPVIEQSFPISQSAQAPQVQTSKSETPPKLGGAIIPLKFRAIDAEYSLTLNRIVMVSENPHQLHIYDPFWKNDTTIELLQSPTSVSISPDGKFAAVGHDAKISYVDLQRRQVVKVLDVTTKVFDIVLAGNGWVYVSPKQDQWETLRAVEIATNNEVKTSGRSIYAGSVYKLHPDGQSLYGANRGLSPSDIEKIDISKTPPVYAYDSPYHGDHEMCGNLWFSEDGLRIFTACGNVFRASSNREQDMTYNGSLSRLNFIQHLVHSRAAGKVLAISGIKMRGWSEKQSLPENQIAIFGAETLNTEKIVTLPDFIVNNKPFAANARFVFVNSQGNTYYTIVQAAETSGLLNDFGLTINKF